MRGNVGVTALAPTAVGNPNTLAASVTAATTATRIGTGQHAK
ncbi:hypothetical protein [Frankia sp. AgKG'84/4]|nr:hypothetical protein [Frankia sp. AgKG'84/4]